MKALRQLCVALVFTLALSLPVFAGEISTMVTSPPPPAQTATTDGEISTGATGQAETGSGEDAATDSFTQAALNLIQSLLALF